MAGNIGGQRKTMMGVPWFCAAAVIAACLMGIAIGSFFDFRISESLANVNTRGTLFNAFGSYLAYCMYPAAGTCLFVGLNKLGERYRLLAWALLAVAFFMAVYYINSYSGSVVRDLAGYVPGKSNPLKSVCCWLIWVVLYAWIPPVLSRMLDDREPEKLIAIGASIILAGILSDNVNLWLKQVASRPRFRYLIKLDDPLSEYREWWQMVPNLAQHNNNFKSWPSGRMTIATIALSAPLITDSLKKRSETINLCCFCLACLYVVIYGYNRIHMSAHFLSDVCFGTLITYVIFAGMWLAFSSLCKADCQEGS